jgi:hypothetical protein
VGCLGCQANNGGTTGGGQPFEVEVTSVTYCESGQEASPKDGPAREGALGVKVRLTGRYESGVPANYFYASLLSRDGTRYLAATAGCRPLLSGPPLLPGESREGYVNFPLQAKKGADRLAYAPNLDHTTFAERLTTKDRLVEAPLP